MRAFSLIVLATSVAAASAESKAQSPRLTAAVRQYVVVDTPTVVIRNVRVIDGTGAPAKENQTIVISGGRIAAIGPFPIPNSQFPLLIGAQVIAGEGKTVIPGFVLVHEHMFYPATTSVPTPTYVEHAYSFPKLYLGAGITTARTGGSMSPYADLNIKRWIDAGTIPGPKLDVTGPYLSGPGLPLAQFHELADSADARRTVRYWADLGATSFKAYMHITKRRAARGRGRSAQARA